MSLQRCPAVLVGMLMLLLVAPMASAGEATPRQLRVVASFSILADMARNIGGDAVKVISLVGPNADAHVFEPTPDDARRVAGADLLIVNGLGFEGWLDRLIRASGYRGPVVVATQGIRARVREGKPDPHAWQDLANGRVYVDNIRDAFIAAAPARRQMFNARATTYSAQLAALDAQARARFAAIPADRRRVITSHDAFEYFGAAYGIELLAPEGWSTESEPSAADVARLIRQLKTKQVRAVFVENITDPRMVERLGHDGGAIIGGTLYSDALSTPGTAGDTYLTMFQHNVSTLLGAIEPGATASPSP